jgi:hypothetical protein
VLAVPVVGEGLPHIVGTPAGQTLGHALPSAVEGLYHLGGCSGGRAGHIPVLVRLHVGAAVFAQEFGEPAGTAADDVLGILADGAQVRGGTQLKLLGGERRKRPFDVILVRFPGGVERREREVVFSHVLYLLGWHASALEVVACCHSALRGAQMNINIAAFYHLSMLSLSQALEILASDVASKERER